MLQKTYVPTSKLTEFELLVLITEEAAEVIQAATLTELNEVVLRYLGMKFNDPSLKINSKPKQRLVLRDIES